MNKDNIVNEDVFECKMYITDLETNKNSKEINVSDLVFNDWIEFEFGDYEDEDYGTLPYKDFKFFINDYSVTFYSPQYQKAIKEIERLNTNLEVANEDLTRIAQLLNLEEGCTIYDIENEIERLNNIINELEKHCETMLSIFGQMTDEQRQEQLDRYKIYDRFLKRLQELKGVDKE